MGAGGRRVRVISLTTSDWSEKPSADTATTCRSRAGTPAPPAYRYMSWIRTSFFIVPHVAGSSS